MKNKFQRSRSEILMSQSPPNSFYGKEKLTGAGEYRSTTLPRDRGGSARRPRAAGGEGARCLPRAAGGERGGQGGGSPTLSVRSLTLKPNGPSPRLGKVKFSSSPSNMYKMNEMRDSPVPNGKIQYLVAVHRLFNFNFIL